MIVTTIVHKGPIIFLKRAEENDGEFDAIVSPKESSDHFLQKSFLNFTKMAHASNTSYNLSPRKAF
jgi:hypothetical protein